jgi:hypothetical protein
MVVTRHIINDVLVRARYAYAHFKQLLQSDQHKNAAIFVDEIFLVDKSDLQALTEIAKLCEGRNIWLAITGMYTNKIKPEEVEAAFAKLDFYIPELHNPIRNSSAIIKHAHPEFKKGM